MSNRNDKTEWQEYLEQEPYQQPRIDALSPGTVSVLHLGDRYIGTSARMTDRQDAPENDLERDLFWSLYRNGEELKDPIPASRVVNGKLINWLTGGATWGNTKAISQGRLLVSTNSAEVMTESLLSDPEVQKMLDEQKKVEEQENQAQQVQQQAEQQEGAGNPSGAAQARQKANDAQNKANALAQALADKLDKFEDSPKGRAMQSAINSQGKQAAQDTSEEMAGWGIEDGQGSDMDAVELNKLLKQTHDSKIANLSKLIGRVHGVAQHTLSSRKHIELVTTDAGYTHNPSDIFTDELAMLAGSMPNSLRCYQMAKLQDEGLLGIIKSVETKEEGDLVIAVDGSGSMDGNREYLAKALTLGIAEAASENGQGWHAFTFGAGEELTDTITGETELETRLKWSTFLFNGGTDFDMALNHAIEEVKGMEDPTATDIVMITDGDCDVDDDTVAKLHALKDEHGTRLIGILVDTGYGTLDRVADAVITIRGTDEIESAAEKLSQSLWK